MFPSWRSTWARDEIERSLRRGVLFAPLKQSLSETVQTFRAFRRDIFQFDGRIIFNLAIIAVAVYALWLSEEWSWDTKLVPQTAFYLVLISATLNLLTESVSARERVGQRPSQCFGAPQ